MPDERGIETAHSALPGPFPTALIRRWNSLSRESLVSNDRFVAERAGGFLVRRRRSEEAEAALHSLLPDPDRLLEAGSVLPGRGNRCLSAVVEIGGRRYVLKRYDSRGWWYRFRHIFRRSRALRGWLCMWSFLIRGFDVPQPLICLEERRWRLLGRAYLLSEFVEGSERLSDFWPRASNEDRESLVRRFASLFGRLHASGCIHGDSNWDNLLLTPDQGKGRLILVDFDCSRVYGRARPDRARRDIQHFMRDMDRLDSEARAFETLFQESWSAWIEGSAK